jgi:thioredoxin reductase
MPQELDGEAVDVVIVGGGPAGLSAALLLGRCRRRVIVLDTGEYRNAVAERSHGFLTRDGATPLEILEAARADLASYPSVQLVQARATEVVVHKQGPPRVLEVRVAGAPGIVCRRVVLATGVVDDLPELPGAQEVYGKGLFHCPYCDGWEHRERPLVALGRGPAGVELALHLLAWSSRITLCTRGPEPMPELPEEGAARLARNGIVVHRAPVAAFEPGPDGRLATVRLTDGTVLPTAAVFFRSHERQRAELGECLGCARDEGGMIVTSAREESSVPGVYVTGDASGRRFHIAIVAAAEGARAAMAVNTALTEEDSA